MRLSSRLFADGDDCAVAKVDIWLQRGAMTYSIFLAGKSPAQVARASAGGSDGTTLLIGEKDCVVGSPNRTGSRRIGLRLGPGEAPPGCGQRSPVTRFLCLFQFIGCGAKPMSNSRSLRAVGLVLGGALAGASLFAVPKYASSAFREGEAVEGACV